MPGWREHSERPRRHCAGRRVPSRCPRAPSRAADVHVRLQIIHWSFPARRQIYKPSQFCCFEPACLDWSVMHLPGRGCHRSRNPRQAQRSQPGSRQPVGRCLWAPKQLLAGLRGQGDGVPGQGSGGQGSAAPWPHDAGDGGCAGGAG